MTFHRQVQVVDTANNEGHKDFLNEMSKEKSVTNFEEQSFMILLDHITVHSKTTISVTFKDGTVS